MYLYIYIYNIVYIVYSVYSVYSLYASICNTRVIIKVCQK